MKVTTKGLRTQVREILDCLDRGEPVTITYRGKPRARVINISDEKVEETPDGPLPVFGMWQDRDDLKDVDAYVRKLRKGRNFAD